MPGNRSATALQKIGATWKRIALGSVALETLAGSHALHRLAELAGVILLLLLGTYHQPYYPSSWLDEGFVLQGPINLARYGQYAMKSVEGFRVLDQPLIANGPGVVLPISGAFALFGVGLLQARLVMAGSMVMAAIAFFVLAKRMYGLPAAWVSSFLLLAVPQEGFLFFGRQALGLVPALAYFLLGYLFWLTSLERDSWEYALGAGSLFGLAMVTKGQYILLIPTLLVVALVDRVYYKAIGLKKIGLVLLVTLACLAIWNGVQLMLVGLENFGHHLNAIRASSRVTVFAFRPMRVPRNLWYLIRSGLPLFIVPGLVYAAWSCRKRDLHSCRHLLLVIFVPIWLAWYVFASTGWHRYAFEPYSVGMLFVGKFVIDTTLFLRRDDSASRGRGQLGVSTRRGRLLLIVAILMGGIWGFAQQVRDIVAEPDRSLQVFAYYLQDHVSPEAVIESWDWQIDALTELTYHHPPNAWVDNMTAVDRYHEDMEVTYDPFEYQPDYLIDGPWSKEWDLYTPYLSNGCCALMFSVTPYDLYEVNIGAIER